ncbi:hypothetical protein CBL_11019 [Carabus blaptoides fortunei]
MFLIVILKEIASINLAQSGKPCGKEVSCSWLFIFQLKRKRGIEQTAPAGNKLTVSERVFSVAPRGLARDSAEFHPALLQGSIYTDYGVTSRWLGPNKWHKH